MKPGMFMEAIRYIKGFLNTEQRSYWLVSSLEWGCSFSWIWYYHRRSPHKLQVLKHQSRIRGWRLLRNEKKVKHFWTEPKCDILHRDLKRNAMTSCHFWAGRGWIKSAHLNVPANRHNWLLSAQSPFLQYRQNQDIFITQKVRLPTTPKKKKRNFWK